MEFSSRGFFLNYASTTMKVFRSIIINSHYHFNRNTEFHNLEIGRVIKKKFHVSLTLELQGM